ncbi:S1 family peptidase [Nodosilinea nodulosa]|uniref:S1 family peptidase n=1 Tax=Nodosilinea nodulosa TaxID=416001 RepID=UPI0002F614CC|nr:serine protease [Nodosilinea nodulosa]
MNHSTIEQLVEVCTVKINIPGSEYIHGTGFFIAPGIIVTCAHVLNYPATQEVTVSIRGNGKILPARLVHSFAPEIDLAILQANIKSTSSCVYVDNEINPRDLCFSFGYTDPIGGNPEGDPITLECEGLAGEKRSIIKLKGGQVRPGMSGAPLLNQRTGKICGVINKTRSEQIHLGGEALSLKVIFEKFPPLKQVHDHFHQSNSDWLNYLQEDVEPFRSDWSRLDRNSQTWSSYIRALLFLVTALFKWLVLGLKAPRAFPIETISLLIKHTLKGSLGQEISKQRKELSKRLIEVDPESGGQARIINRLESKASILSELITILIPESQNLASSSRLLWAVELIYEQQDLLNELKEIKGNSYPELEHFRNKFIFLKTSSDKRYRKIDKVISKLLSKYPGYDRGFLAYSHVVLDDLVELTLTSPVMGRFIVSEVYNYLRNSISTVEGKYLGDEDEDEYAILVKSVIEELENDIKNYPRLIVLKKMKILLENVAGKPIVGGPYRAWGKSKSKNKHHFSRKCKFYPERARPHEMNKISCYDSHEQARENHEPCKTCISAENIESIDFIGDEPS